MFVPSFWLFLFLLIMISLEESVAKVSLQFLLPLGWGSAFKEFKTQDLSFLNGLTCWGVCKTNQRQKICCRVNLIVPLWLAVSVQNSLFSKVTSSPVLGSERWKRVLLGQLSQSRHLLCLWPTNDITPCLSDCRSSVTNKEGNFDFQEIKLHLDQVWCSIKLTHATFTSHLFCK